jgi:anion-transporting  ArsA/GET3 family ATPase
MPVTLQLFDPPRATALLVRTEQALNLESVLGTPLGSAPRPIPRVLGREAPIADPEAAAPEADLRRAGIEPYAWVLNQSLTPLTLTDPLLRARRRAEARYLREVAESHPRVVVLPWSAEPGLSLDSNGGRTP